MKSAPFFEPRTCTVAGSSSEPSRVGFNHARSNLLGLAALVALLFLSACSDRITERGCFGDATVRCRDFAIRQQAAKVAEGITQLKSRRDDLTSRMGQADYDRLLALANERLEAIEDSRPNWFWRSLASDRDWEYRGYVFPHEAEFRRLLAAARGAGR